MILETNIGANKNSDFYLDAKVKKIYAIDWLEQALENGKKKLSDQSKYFFAKGDIHELPFPDNSFDTVVDTFGLECSYEVEKAWNELKRLTKTGGQILLLERGESFWMTENYHLMAKASINLGARG